MELRSSFLTATIVSVILGASIAWMRNGIFNFGYFLFVLVGGAFLHIGANVVNDYFDYLSGNDDVNIEFVRPFSGGSRMIQLGLLTPLEVLFGGILFFVLGISLGLYLSWIRGWFILILGLICVISGFFYTSAPFSWANRGVGEAIVGVNFGVLITLGTYYVQTQTLSIEPLISSIPVSLLIAAVLYINEFPDYNADKAVGKNTLVVRLARRRAAQGYAILMSSVYGSILFGVFGGVLPASTLIGFMTLPLSINAILHTFKHHSSSFELVPANALTVICHLSTSLLLSIGYIIEQVGSQKLIYISVIGVLFALFMFFIIRQMEQQKDAAS